MCVKIYPHNFATLRGQRTSVKIRVREKFSLDAEANRIGEVYRRLLLTPDRAP